jgi:hypothetical protein
MALSPLFEHFFILGGPRGFRQKKLQKIDSIQLKGGLIEIIIIIIIIIILPHVKMFDCWSFRGYLIIIGMPETTKVNQ